MLEILFQTLFYGYTIIVVCHEENEKTCMDQHGANSCKKINGVDTCLCGNSRECDPHKRKKLCLNGQGHKIKDDPEAKCRRSKNISNILRTFLVVVFIPSIISSPLKIFIIIISRMQR